MLHQTLIYVTDTVSLPDHLGDKDSQRVPIAIENRKVDTYTYQYAANTSVQQLGAQHHHRPSRRADYGPLFHGCTRYSLGHIRAPSTEEDQ